MAAWCPFPPHREKRCVFETKPETLPSAHEVSAVALPTPLEAVAGGGPVFESTGVRFAG